MQSLARRSSSAILMLCDAIAGLHGDLVGLTNTFDIIIAGGKHSYDFAYPLPSPH